MLKSMQTEQFQGCAVKLSARSTSQNMSKWSDTKNVLFSDDFLIGPRTSQYIIVWWWHLCKFTVSNGFNAWYFKSPFYHYFQITNKSVIYFIVWISSINFANFGIKRNLIFITNGKLSTTFIKPRKQMVECSSYSSPLPTIKNVLVLWMIKMNLILPMIFQITLTMQMLQVMLYFRIMFGRKGILVDACVDRSCSEGLPSWRTL